MNKFELVCKEFNIPCEKIYENGLRTRVNFALYKDNGKISYAMFKDKCKITDFDTSFICDEIRDFMPKLLENLDEALKDKLFEIRFFKSFYTLNVLLLYHKDIKEFKIGNYYEKLSKLTKLKLNIIMQSRKQRIAYPNDILEHFSNGIKYEFNDECFIQPSLLMNEKMLEFAISCAKVKPNADLLELYCGYGNFTLALAPYFKKVFATELSKKNVEFLNTNCKINNTNNIYTARLKDGEVKDAFNKVRAFNRLKHINLDDFCFSHILIDPPRCGLGECVELVKNYDNIIYISCNPLTAKIDLEKLCKTHELKRFVLFDQFINSEHLECGFYLERIKDDRA